MNLSNNKKGLTLVEIIIAICILGLIGTAFASCIASSLKIVNKATLYKNASATAQSMIELQDENYAKSKNYDDNIDVSLTKSGNMSCNIKYKTYTKGADQDDVDKLPESSFTINGDILSASDKKGSKLTYREFLPGNYYFIP